jgi:glyoxylase-like metal-dependent hydrolase (beta-lactamase superfamily II)
VTAPQPKAPLAEWARCVLAPNPGPMTLTGTNTWVLSAPGSVDCVVVDPGPEDAGHRAAVLAVVEAAGQRVAQVLLTHAHPDHAEGAATFAAAVGAPLRAPDPSLVPGAEALVVEESARVGDLRLAVVQAAGHTADSVAFVLPDAGLLLTGDTVLGSGWTVVAHPDGRLGDYLATLDRLQRLVELEQIAHLLPGHGPVVDDPTARLEEYRRHREQRLEQVRAAWSAGDRSAEQVVARVYADVPRELWPAATLSVQAQLAYLGQSPEGPSS